MGSGKKGFHAAKIDCISALYAMRDAAADGLVAFLYVFQLVKDLHALCFFKRQGDCSLYLVFTHDIDIDRVAFPDAECTVAVKEFTRGYLSF